MLIFPVSVARAQCLGGCSPLTVLDEIIEESLLAGFVLNANAGSVLVLAGVDVELLHRLVDHIEPQASTPRALFCA